MRWNKTLSFSDASVGRGTMSRERIQVRPHWPLPGLSSEGSSEGKQLRAEEETLKEESRSLSLSKPGPLGVSLPSLALIHLHCNDHLLFVFPRFHPPSTNSHFSGLVLGLLLGLLGKRHPLFPSRMSAWSCRQPLIKHVEVPTQRNQSQDTESDS